MISGFIAVAALAALVYKAQAQPAYPLNSIAITNWDKFQADRAEAQAMNGDYL